MARDEFGFREVHSASVVDRDSLCRPVSRSRGLSCSAAKHTDPARSGTPRESGFPGHASDATGFLPNDAPAVEHPFELSLKGHNFSARACLLQVNVRFVMY